MLGQDLVAVLGRHHEVIPTYRADADITDRDDIYHALARSGPEMVVHAAAFTGVDECERHSDIAFRVNGEGTRNVAEACRRLGVSMLYLSTDYVFDGEKSSAYSETDTPNPLSVYGRSKWDGEKHVEALVARFWIVRVSWLFGSRGKNFVKAILRQARHGNVLKVVDDQVGAPTYTMDLVAKIDEIIGKAAIGIYHVTNQGCCSWFEFAREILKQAGLTEVAVLPISTSDAGRPAPRPRNSRLANTRLKAEGLELLPPWQEALARYLARAGGRHGE